MHKNKQTEDQEAEKLKPKTKNQEERIPLTLGKSPTSGNIRKKRAFLVLTSPFSVLRSPFFAFRIFFFKRISLKQL